jgi:glycosyltransferase involved in cell wall biosynthesis
LTGVSNGMAVGDRLCLFLPSLAGGGAERSLVLLANGFAARGHDVDLVLVKQHGPWIDSVDSKVRVIDLGASRAAKAILPLARYLRSARPRVILSALDQANVVAALACAIARCRSRLVVSIRLPIGKAVRDNRGLRHRATRMLARLVYPRAARIIAISDGVRDDLLATFPVPPEKVVTVYNPVVDEAFWERAARPPALTLPADDVPFILAAGRLHPVKGFDTLIRAFARMRDTNRARLIILGEGAERDRLTSLAAELGLGSDVLMPGFDPNPLPYMTRAAVFVSSSVWEGFGNSIVEAMALGVPTVCTACDGPREILQDGKWGRLVSPGDEAALAAAMVEALRTRAPDPRERGRQFSADAAVDGYLSVMLPD